MNTVTAKKRLLGEWHGGVLLAAAIVFSWAAQATDLRIGSLPADVSTATADAYFPSDTLSTREIWGPDPTLNRPAEIKDLARALRNNVDLIHEYVHDNVQTVFMYGLQKGALGALIDRSGTSFDQAQLMVELLRESGYSARYKVGTIELNAAQATAWLGTSDATSAQRILRDGGIPLDYTASGPSYKIAHVWVEVTIPGSSCGTTCWFDPSYKSYNFKSPLANLSTLMGWSSTEFTTSSSGFLTKSWSGMQQQATPADPIWVSKLNETNLRAKLQSYASTLLTNLRSATYKDKEIEDIVGGQDIVKTGGGPFRNSGVLPGFLVVAQRTWDCTDASHCGVPDSYRTSTTISVLNSQSSNGLPAFLTKKLFVDETYGRRVQFVMPAEMSLPNPGGSGWETYEQWCVRLTVDDKQVTGGEMGCQGETDPLPPLRGRFVRVEVDHPYPAAQPDVAGAPAGSYMDATAQLGNEMSFHLNFAAPASFVQGWGDVSAALVSKQSAEIIGDQLLPPLDLPNGAEPRDNRPDSANDHTMAKIGASYMAQYSRMAEIQKRLGNAEHVLHHLVGFVYAQVDIQNNRTKNQDSTEHDWYIRDRALGITLIGAASINSKTNTPVDRQKVVHSVVAAAGALEGSVFEQIMDTPEVGSTASRFQWASENFTSTPIKFYLYTPATDASQVGAGYTTLGCDSSAGSIDNNAVAEYVARGYWAIAAAEQCLGPGNKYGSQATTPPQITMQRGGAFVAFKIDDSAVAHATTYELGNNLGGGAGVPASYNREFDAAGAASLLKDKFEDKGRLFGVDLQTGDFVYTAPTDLRVGEGGFPYELALTRTFKAGAAQSPGLREGWMHSMDVRANISGDGFAAMGQNSARDAAATIAALYTAQQIFSVSPASGPAPTAAQMQSHLKRWVLAPLVMDWWRASLTNNVVTLNAGHDSKQFTRLVDGKFNPPRNGAGTLAQTGQRALHPKPNGPAGEYDRWDYSPVSFTFTSSEQDKQTFAYYESQILLPAQGFDFKNYGRRHGWHLASWTFPFGVSLSFAYVQNDNVQANVDRLISVSNNLGRSFSFNYSKSPSWPGDILLDSIGDGQGRTVTYGRTGTNTFAYHDTVTSPEQEVTQYEYALLKNLPDARPKVYPKLAKIFSPSDGSSPKVELTYDRSWRVLDYKDAVAIKLPAQRSPWTLYVTGNSRGERLDPDGNLYTAYFDKRGRTIQVIDEEGRSVNQTFDNHDRVAQRTFPEGNRTQFAYDDVTQQITRITSLPKSSAYWSTALTNIVLSATYDPTCGKVKTVTDAKSKLYTWNYDATRCTLTSIQQPQVANAAAGGTLTNPLTQYSYNSFGQITQLTDPTSRVVSFDYDASTNYQFQRHGDPSGLNLTTTYSHNAYGDISSVTDPRSNSTIYNFDRQRRLTRIDSPLSATTINRYDLDGDVYQVERAMDAAQTQWQIWHKTFTPTKKVDQEFSPLNEITSYAYDALDRVSVVTDPDGRKAHTEYFKDGKTKQIIKAYQSTSIAPIEYATYTLTPNGQVDTVTDANSNVTNYDYDGFDRLIRSFYPDPATGAACAPALPHSAAAPSCSANQKYEQLAYDANNNAISKRNRDGKNITMTFDDLNREITRTVPANLLGHFARSLPTSYDLASRKWDATADSQTLSYRYDTAGRLDYVDDSTLGAANRIDSVYDAAGNRTGLNYPGGTSVSFSYDALNRLDIVTESGLTLADYDWDTLSRRDLVKFNNSSFSQDFSFSTDDNLSSLSHTGPVPLNFNFGRNHSGQVTNLIASDTAFLAKPATVATENYVPNRLNQYTTVAGIAQSYDANGNLTSDGAYTFEYDEENRLRSAVGNGNTVSYEYDPEGRRRAKVVNGVITKYVSDGVEEIEERDGNNTVLRKYVYGSGVDDRIAMIDSVSCAGGRCFYLTNWQGSTTTVVNQTNTTNAVYHYGPYGEGTNWTPSDALTGNPFRYTGRRVDAETGLYYYRARYYSPRSGRFLQTDPIGYKDDFNSYAYVGNDPGNATDPSGEACVVGNGWSDYCRRAHLYGSLDQRLGNQTRFFAAASATVQVLANMDLPIAGRYAASAGVRNFMTAVSSKLETLNKQSALAIESGQLGGPGLDARMVHIEQTAVQGSLNQLRDNNSTSYKAVVDGANALLNPSGIDKALSNSHSTDAAYGRILDGVRQNLGRNIDFSSQSDREAIGNAVIRFVRETGGCDVTGTRIKSC